jgi:hypothetical protein
MQQIYSSVATVAAGVNVYMEVFRGKSSRNLPLLFSTGRSRSELTVTLHVTVATVEPSKQQAPHFTGHCFAARLRKHCNVT